MRKLVARTGTVLVAAVAVSTAGVAYAAWTATGGGFGSAAATTADALTTPAAVAVSSALASGDLYPGYSGGALSVTFNNTNDYPVTITSISQNTGAGHYVSSDKGAACSDANGANPTGVSFAGATNPQGDTVADWVVPANDSATHVVARNVTMSNSSANGCQGATFSIPVTFTGVSGTR